MFKHEFLPPYELPAEVIDGKRYYTTPTGEKYPSVTTVLSDILDKTGLEKWRKRVGEEEANRIAARAADRGTKVHALLEKYLSNDMDCMKKDSAMPDIRVLFNDMIDIIDGRVGTVYGIEHPLYSHRLRTAGKTDLIAEFDGVKSIVDFKTASRYKKESDILGYFLQSTCYALMVGERTGIYIPQIVILICVEHDHPQVFIKKTEDYMKQVVYLYKNHKLPIF